MFHELAAVFDNYDYDFSLIVSYCLFTFSPVVLYFTSASVECNLTHHQ